MSADGIDEPVGRFLATHISSLGQLEVLLLLHATEGREWSADECSRELASDVRWIQPLLADLAARGFLVVRESETGSMYRYEPATGEIQRLIEGAARAYKERRLSVINLIYGKSESDAVSFSAAFTILKKKGG